VKIRLVKLAVRTVKGRTVRRWAVIAADSGRILSTHPTMRAAADEALRLCGVGQARATNKRRDK
jgi:hypothetical protein